MRKYQLPTDEIEKKRPFCALLGGLGSKISKKLDSIWTGLNQQADIREVKDYTEFLVLTGSLKPDLLIFDIHMPGLDGMKLIDLLHKNEAWKDTKVIVISELSDGEMDSLKKLGVHTLNSKNVKPEQLKKAVIKAVGVK
jgi:CheY-like chemotaxis protein